MIIHDPTVDDFDLDVRLAFPGRLATLPRRQAPIRMDGPDDDGDGDDGDGDGGNGGPDHSIGDLCQVTEGPMCHHTEDPGCAHSVGDICPVSEGVMCPPDEDQL